MKQQLKLLPQVVLLHYHRILYLRNLELCNSQIFLSMVLIKMQLIHIHLSIQVDAYYVAGRQVPTVFNGMATAADWMSGASFVAMAGGIYCRVSFSYSS